MAKGTRLGFCLSLLTKRLFTLHMSETVLQILSTPHNWVHYERMNVSACVRPPGRERESV